MIRHPNERGEWVELQFMTRAAAHGLVVSAPWGHFHPYDLVIEHQGKFSLVQVKSTSHHLRGHYHCHCTPPTRRKAYQQREIDFLAAYVIPEDVWYIIPVEEIASKKAAILLAPYKREQKFFQYIESWHLFTRRPNRGTLPRFDIQACVDPMASSLASGGKTTC